jgi:hypothetical protein
MINCVHMDLVYITWSKQAYVSKSDVMPHIIYIMKMVIVT